MKVDIVDSYTEFTALEANWNILYHKDPEAQFFLSWTWLSGVFRENPNQWRVLAVRPDKSGSDYLGFFPITLKTVWSKRHRMFRNEIHMAGTLFWGQYTGFVCHPNWEQQVIAGLTEHLKKMHWSRISLKYLFLSDKRRHIFTKQFSDKVFRTSYHKRFINKGATNNLICPYIDLPDDYETYLQTCLSPNTRQKIRRFTRRLENSDDLYITTTNSDTFQKDLDILMDLWAKKWTASKGRKTKHLVRKFRQILQQGFECDSLYLPILWRGDTPLGALASFVDWLKPNLYYFVSGRDETCKDQLVGWVLHAHCIRWAIENGIRTYDFCHGDEPFKYSYGAKDRHLKHMIISSRSGVNLNDILDPYCIEEVMGKIIRFLEEGFLEEAKTACQQIQAVSQATKRFKIHVGGGRAGHS